MSYTQTLVKGDVRLDVHSRVHDWPGAMKAAEALVAAIGLQGRVIVDVRKDEQ